MGHGGLATKYLSKFTVTHSLLWKNVYKIVTWITMVLSRYSYELSDSITDHSMIKDKNRNLMITNQFQNNYAVGTLSSFVIFDVNGFEYYVTYVYRQFSIHYCRRNNTRKLSWTLGVRYTLSLQF